MSFIRVLFVMHCLRPVVLLCYFGGNLRVCYSVTLCISIKPLKFHQYCTLTQMTNLDTHSDVGVFKRKINKFCSVCRYTGVFVFIICFATGCVLALV